MIWILLAALGVPLWLLAVALLLILRSRRRFRRRPEVFECRLRPVEPDRTSSDAPRGKHHAYWAHDVLLVHRGVALIRYDALPVASVDGPVTAVTTESGERQVQLRLRLDDGRQIDLVARNEDADRATGRYSTASTT
jgi:hypothetical protein